ncbi:MAG: PAC2 family protein [Candidatus Aenigmatarchaeota archaeon]
MAIIIKEFKKIKTKNGIFIEGMPGVGNVGLIAASYLVEQLKPEVFAELHTGYFGHAVLIKPNAEIQLLKGTFYYYKNRGKEIVFYIGDQQAISPEKTFDLVNKILSYLKKIGIKTVITLGGIQKGYPTKQRKVYGAVSEEKVKEKFKNLKIDFDNVSKDVGSIIGAVGMLTGYAKYYGLEGLCLLSESFSTPFVPDHKGAKALLEVLEKILEIEIDYSRINKKIKEQESIEEKLSKVPISQPKEEVEEKKLSYLG